MAKNNDKIMVKNVKISISLHNRLKQEAVSQGITLQNLVEKLLSKFNQNK